MKILYPNNISTVTTDSADSDYPVANVQDDHPQKVWKADAGVTTATLSIVTSAFGAAGLHIAGTNATTGTVTIKNSTEVTTYETHSLSGAWGRYFLKFTAAWIEVLHITIELTAPATVYAGVVRCGTLIDIPDPQYGLKHQRKDYSIKKELSNGGMSIINRNMPRKYDLSFMIPQTDYDELDNLYLANGSLPLAMLISDNINADDQYSGFFHTLDPPSGTYNHLTYAGCSMAIQEAV